MSQEADTGERTGIEILELCHIMLFWQKRTLSRHFQIASPLNMKLCYIWFYRSKLMLLNTILYNNKIPAFSKCPFGPIFYRLIIKTELLHSITWISLIQALSRDRFQFCIQSNWLLPILAKLLFQSATKTFPFIIMVALDIKTTIELTFCFFKGLLPQYCTLISFSQQM